MSSTILKLGVFILVVIGGAFLLSSTKQKKIPIELLLGNPEKVSPQISPSGEKLAYLAPDTNNVLNVYVQEKVGKVQALEPITKSKKRNITQFLWQYDSAHILYLQDKDGDENWHIYQTNITTKQTEDLTPFPGVVASILSYRSEYPDRLLVLLNKRDPALFDVYELCLTTKELTLIEENTKNVVAWHADTKLQVRARVFYDAEGNSHLEVRNASNEEWRSFMEWKATEEGMPFGFSADGGTLYIGLNTESNTISLFAVNIQTGEKTLLASNPRYDISHSLLWDPSSNAPQAVGILQERLTWFSLDETVGKDLQFLQRTGEEVNITSRDLKDEYWVVSKGTDKESSFYTLYHRPTQTEEFLFSARPELKKYTLSSMEPITYTARDGMELHGYLTLPVEGKGQRHPMVLLVHGGPWSRDQWGYNGMVQWLANRGYTVLQVNFRGSTGYGKDYLNAAIRQWAGKMHTDLLDAKEWAIANGYAIDGKVAIMGGSYGGYATLVGLTFTPQDFCCGIDIVGPSNLVTLLQTVPPYWTPVKTFFDLHVGNLDTEKEFLESRSPLFKVDQICRPLLIAQGANDPRVKQSESDQIVEAMQKAGKPVEYLLFPDDGHGFGSTKNKIIFAEAAEKFLEQHLQ